MLTLATFLKGLEPRPPRASIVHGSLGPAVEQGLNALVAAHDLEGFGVERIDLRIDPFEMVLDALRVASPTTRLIVVREPDAEREHWRLTASLLRERALFRNHLCVVSPADKIAPDGILRTSLPSTTKVANCGVPSMNQALAWGATQGVPRFLMRGIANHVEDDFARAMQFVAKMSYMPHVWDRLTVEHIPALVPLDVGEGFADALCRNNKPLAYQHAVGVPASAMATVLSLVLRRVDWLSRLHRHAVVRTPVKKMSKDAGVPAFFVAKWHKEAATYSAATVTRRLDALSHASVALSRGASTGVMETVVALW